MPPPLPSSGNNKSSKLRSSSRVSSLALSSAKVGPWIKSDSSTCNKKLLVRRTDLHFMMLKGHAQDTFSTKCNANLAKSLLGVMLSCHKTYITRILEGGGLKLWSHLTKPLLQALSLKFMEYQVTYPLGNWVMPNDQTTLKHCR
jgi:hypothetical protein